ncbi:hypothetical protein Pelo_5421 [Pelomyxa schiedti]|nr:hypothetical protein Pelo_5421 [Pelomyxa schiedti]
MKRGDVVGVEQLARVSYDRDRMILHRALAHGRPRVRPPKYAILYGSFAPRPPWAPCVRILLNLPGITETFSCLYEGKSITSLAAYHSEWEAKEVMQLLFEAGADPNGIEGEETHPFIYSKIAGEDMAGLFLSHPKFNLEKADLSKIFAQSSTEGSTILVGCGFIFHIEDRKLQVTEATSGTVVASIEYKHTWCVMRQIIPCQSFLW